jgi:hypothetical protein
MTMVYPHEEVRFAVTLAYPNVNPAQTLGEIFDARFEVVAAEFNDRGPVAPLRHYPVTISNIHRTLPPTPAMEAQVEKTLRMAYPGPEVLVGKAGFRVLSFRSEKDFTGSQRKALIYLEVFNHGDRPLILDEAGAYLANEYNYRLGQAVRATGVPLEQENHAAVSTPIDPGSSIRFAIRMYGGRRGAPGQIQTDGATFDFEAVFDAFEDQGEGRLRKLRTYPVAFTQLHQTDDSGGLSPLNAGTQSIGDLQFDYTGFHLTVDSRTGVAQGTLTLNLTNTSNVPVAINFDFPRSLIVDDVGMLWEERKPPLGVPYTYDGNKANLRSPLPPQSRTPVELHFDFLPNDHDRASPGAVFDFAGAFCSWIDVGQGQAQLTRCFPISFLGLRAR